MNDQVTVSKLMDSLRQDVLKRQTEDTGNSSMDESVPRESRSDAIHGPSQKTLEPPFMELSFDESGNGSFRASLDRIYRIEDVLAYHDRQFIDVAYRALLLRAPDPEGFANYLKHLRNGTSKIQILNILRCSSEGRAANVHVAGLRSRLFWSKLRSLPILGPLLVFFGGVWRTPDADKDAQVLEGRLLNLLDSTRTGTRQSLFAANAAIENLAEVASHVTANLISKASRDEVASMENSLRQALNAMEQHWNTSSKVASHLQRTQEEMELKLANGLNRVSQEWWATTSAFKSEVGEISQKFVSQASVIRAAHSDAEERLEDIRRNLSEHDQALSEIFSTIERLSSTKADVASLDSSMVELRNGVLSSLAADAAKSLLAAESLAHSKIEHFTLLQTIGSEIRQINDALDSVSEANGELKRTALDQERRLLLLLEEARKRMPEPMVPAQMGAMLKEEDHVLDAMYASFEDKFRGTREAIRGYQRDYLPYIRKAGAGKDGAPVIDLGCGRGEWLEELGNQGLHAQGVDRNRVFLESCRDLKLDVVEADAIEFLRSRQAKSIGAITSFHLIEHLPRTALISLLDESIRVLKPGGVIILETPNPENLLVGAFKFYYDPTHIRPLPPASTQFLLESRGFVNVVTKDLHPDAHYASLISEMPKLASHFSIGQDYMLVGWKA